MENDLSPGVVCSTAVEDKAGACWCLCILSPLCREDHSYHLPGGSQEDSDISRGKTNPPRGSFPCADTDLPGEEVITAQEEHSLQPLLTRAPRGGAEARGSGASMHTGRYTKSPKSPRGKRQHRVLISSPLNAPQEGLNPARRARGPEPPPASKERAGNRARPQRHKTKSLLGGAGSHSTWGTWYVGAKPEKCATFPFSKCIRNVHTWLRILALLLAPFTQPSAAGLGRPPVTVHHPNAHTCPLLHWSQMGPVRPFPREAGSQGQGLPPLHLAGQNTPSEYACCMLKDQH